MTRIAILRYPGTWSERDFAHALSLVEGVESEIQWHEDVDLRGFDAAIVPGGVSYGDYLRAGAIAQLSPPTKELHRVAAGGGAVLGGCNRVQILCEAGVLPRPRGPQPRLPGRPRRGARPRRRDPPPPPPG